jgi:hypothetical protein
MTSTIRPLVGLLPGTAANGLLEELLEQVCAALQISDTHYERAVQHYEAAGRWLGEDGSPLAAHNPRIYPQGSMALQTTTRPWTDEDTFDLDFVLELDAPSEDPMRLYRMVEQRLLEHGTYATLLERKRRCLCLNYTEDGGVFHMDILPAREDVVRAGTCIEVPDRKEPKKWQPSNPLGYIAWFDARAERGVLLERAEQAPLPDNAPAHAKAVLRRAVQLIKRRRDLVFRNRREDAPRSVLLTTLAGTHYHGQLDVASALLAILEGIALEIRMAAPARITVCNPTNTDERFCESFKTHAQYRLFVEFVEQFREEARELLRVTGLPKLQAALGSMFGEKVTRRVLNEYASRVNTDRQDGTLRVEQRGGPATIQQVSVRAGTVGSGIVVPKNTFFGE